MKKLPFPITLAVIFSLLLAACAGPTAAPPGGTPPASAPAQAVQPDSGQPGSGQPPAGQPVLNRDALGSYSAEFLLQFGGSFSWNYLLRVRKAGALREVSLHMEGLDKARNPGDVRLVTDGTQSWMTGEATGGECVQFPNGIGMDPNFIYPETLFSLAEIGAGFAFMGELPANGAELEHFRAEGVQSGPWQSASIDLWQEKGSGMLHRLTVQAQGEDPFFGAGKGNMAANYRLTALDEPLIEPVTGCETSVLLPDAAGQVVRLPGITSFTAAGDPQSLVQFYQAALPQDGWEEAAPPEQVEAAVVLSFRRGSEQVEIAIKPNPSGGSLLEVITLQGP